MPNSAYTKPLSFFPFRSTLRFRIPSPTSSMDTPSRLSPQNLQIRQNSKTPPLRLLAEPLPPLSPRVISISASPPLYNASALRHQLSHKPSSLTINSQWLPPPRCLGTPETGRWRLSRGGIRFILTSCTVRRSPSNSRRRSSAAS